MTDSGWHPIIIVVDPADSQWESRLVAVTPSVAEFESRGVVSFCDPAVGIKLPGGWMTATHWRDLVPPRLHEEMWRDSYADIKALIQATPVMQKAGLGCYLHVLADALTRHRVWHYLAQAVRPGLVILPAGSELMSRARSLRHTQNWFSRIVGGHGNVLRIRGWCVRRRTAREGSRSSDSASGPGLSGIMMVVEDGVSAVHRAPALAIVEELAGRGLLPRVLTSSSVIAAAFAANGHPISLIRPESLPRFAAKILTQCFPLWCGLRHQLTKSSASARAIDAEFLAWLRRSSLGYLIRKTLLLEGIEQAVAQRPVELVFTLGETFPLVITALAWARGRGIPNVGFTPVFIGGRPDNEDFPASTHLVYGDQAAEWMVRQNVAAQTIHVVGSPTYERALGRDRDADIQAIRAVLPGWRVGQRLLVVATEALPGPQAELVPVLQAGIEMDDIYTVIKLHPADSVDAIAAITQQLPPSDRVGVLGTCDLESLLHAADLLVCVQSNIAVTAALLGTPTLVPTFAERYRPIDLVAGEFATECSQPDHLKVLIDNLTRPGAARSAVIEKMRKGLQRFAGHADGRSHVRIVDVVIQLLANANAKSNHEPQP